MRAKYYRVGNRFYVRFKNTKTKQEETVEIDSRAKSYLNFQPPMMGEMDVEIEVTYKGNSASLNWKSMKAVTTSNSNNVSSSEVDRSYGLPKPWCLSMELVGLFKLVREEFRPVLIQYLERKQGLKESDVKLLFLAAEKNYSLAFRSEEEFSNTLNYLVTRPSHVSVLHLNQFTQLTEEAPAIIVIHGSSVDGLRGKKKEGKGWTFDVSSDVDVTIVDQTRFCWAQALGITTYANAQTVELTDIHLRLLKLLKFARQFRLRMGNRKINFCVYNSVQSALTHSGFSLVCVFNRKTSSFQIERLFCKGDDPFAERRQTQDVQPILLSSFFERVIPLQITFEQFVTNDTLEEARERVTLPNQGNHLFNDVHASLSLYRMECKQTLKIKLSDSSPVAHCLLGGYLRLLKQACSSLQMVSRSSSIAEKLHGKSSEVVTKGFDKPSNKENELLFGNALTYFINCSNNFCELALTDYNRPDRLELLIYPLKKAFVTLLDCAVDRKLLEALTSNRSNEVYARKLVSDYERISGEVNQLFKLGLDRLLSALQGVEAHVFVLTKKSDGPILRLDYDIAFSVLMGTRLNLEFLKLIFDPLGTMTNEDRLLWK
ncbi:hypothetical protein [Bryobacter aggregatus]|uniref:hypothetical protein n=1 Tax=Bryobacter aggregatus TaxID=360054 RepID=UPI0004E1C34D|nr:hypothetical protein [Bryobacter aggregatus]